MRAVKARLLAFLIALLGFAGQARADVLYCLEQGSGVLHTTIIAHSKFMDGVRPKELEAWHCDTVFLLFSTTKLGPDTDLNSPEVQTVIYLTPRYWDFAKKFKANYDELRRKTSGKTRVADWDGLIMRMVWDEFQEFIQAANSPQERLQKFVALVAIIRALMKIESDGDPNSLSFAGAMGLVQIMPSTVKDVAKFLSENPGNINPFEPRTNLRYGGLELLKKFKTIWPMALKGNASLRVPLLDAQRKVIKINGKTQYETIYIDGLKPDEVWFYTLTAYNRGIAGWFKWRRFNARQGNASLMSDYALKWARYSREYCSGIDLVKMTCPTTPDWFQKALASDMNRDIAAVFPQ